MHNLIIGETCLLSYQLRRLNIIEGKNELFDNMLVTIDGVYDLLDDNFNNILNEEYLEFINYMYYPDHNISHPKWINKKYSLDKDNIFSWPVFSFFHYDAFNQDQKDSIIRKTNRFKSKLEDNFVEYLWSIIHIAKQNQIPNPYEGGNKNLKGLPLSIKLNDKEDWFSKILPNYVTQYKTSFGEKIFVFTPLGITCKLPLNLYLS